MITQSAPSVQVESPNAEPHVVTRRACVYDGMSPPDHMFVGRGYAQLSLGRSMCANPHTLSSCESREQYWVRFRCFVLASLSLLGALQSLEGKYHVSLQITQDLPCRRTSASGGQFQSVRSFVDFFDLTTSERKRQVGQRLRHEEH